MRSPPFGVMCVELWILAIAGCETVFARLLLRVEGFV